MTLQIQMKVLIKWVTNAIPFVYIRTLRQENTKDRPKKTWPAFWETCMQVRKQQLELDMEQQTGSK